MPLFARIFLQQYQRGKAAEMLHWKLQQLCRLQVRMRGKCKKTKELSQSLNQVYENFDCGQKKHLALNANAWELSVLPLLSWAQL